MSFGNFSSYLAKKNCQQQNYCCLQGPSGERGSEGAKGDTGPMGPGVPNENFVFGWTGISGNTFDRSGQQYWLIPGGQIDRNAYPQGINQPVPSMAVAYDNATITHAAIHISGDQSAWIITPPAAPQFTFKIYSFCEVDLANGVPETSSFADVSGIKYGCNCVKLDPPITPGCAERQALAVSVSPQQNSAAPAKPISISIALYSQTKLGPPP